MLVLSFLLVGIYSICLIIVFVYSLAQLNLTFNFLKSRNKKIQSKNLDSNNLPFVTIQLPIFNEKYLVEDLLHCISAFDYPKHLLEIQVLDDSTDETIETTKKVVDQISKTGIDIKLIHRTDRSGYKAGALKEGLICAKGEFIAIFDADFLPQKDWLFQTLPYFSNEKIGVIQTRWGHTNRNQSILTKIQAFALDFHFTIEQLGRNSEEHFINFNGTAGIWRKSCILDAGNWESDTLTEDLDLSYRAQLKGWKFVYLIDVVTPAELPFVTSAARSQQFRWNKGGAENFVKLFKKVIDTKNITFSQKIHGVIHLLNSSIFLCVFLIGFLSVPNLFIKLYYPETTPIFHLLRCFFVCIIIFYFCYWQSYRYVHGSTLKSFLKFNFIFFTFYPIAMGFALQNSIGIVEAFLGKKSEFVRTPKFNILNKNFNFKQNPYWNKNLTKELS